MTQQHLPVHALTLALKTWGAQGEEDGMGSGGLRSWARELGHWQGGW